MDVVSVWYDLFDMCKMVVTSYDKNFFLGLGYDESGPQEDISLWKSLGWYDDSGPRERPPVLVSSGSVPV